METEMPSFEPDNVGSCKGLEFIDEQAGNVSKKTDIQSQNQTHSSVGEEDGGESLQMGSFYSSLNFHQDKENKAKEGIFLSEYLHEQQLQQLVDLEGFDNLNFDFVSPLPFQSESCSEEIKKLIDDPDEAECSETVEPAKEKPYAVSLEILTNYGCRLRRLNGEKVKIPRFDIQRTGIVKQKLSTTAILKMAGEKFIQSSNPKSKNGLISKLNHPYASSLVDLSEAETKDVQLVQHLLSAAQKIGEKQFYRAKKLLKKCKKLSFDKGNPIQRLVYYFSGALQERIDRETGRCTTKGFGRELSDYFQDTLASINSAVLAFQRALPFSDVSQFAGMQVIIEQVEGATKVHIIDLRIKMGKQYTMLMQALAARSECRIELLKITAVATNSKEAIEATGRRLRSFSQSFNLPFSFSVVMVEDILDLHENLFDLDQDEAVAVYSEYSLMLLLERPDRLESLMRVIRNISPCVMVVIEVEANLNSPVFVNRFIEALFFFSASFDAIEDCLKDDDANRMVVESMFFSQGLKNIVAAEEEERTTRNVKINVWRAFFQRFGMFELDFSMSSMYQANLVLNNFSCGSSCTLEMDGKSVTVGWKGTPMVSLSAWGFD